MRAQKYETLLDVSVMIEMVRLCMGSTDNRLWPSVRRMRIPKTYVHKKFAPHTNHATARHIQIDPPSVPLRHSVSARLVQPVARSSGVGGVRRSAPSSAVGRARCNLTRSNLARDCNLADYWPLALAAFHRHARA